MLAGYPIKQAASGVFGHDEKQESTFVTGVEPLQKREMSNPEILLMALVFSSKA